MHRFGHLLDFDLMRFPHADRWFALAYRYTGWLIYARLARVVMVLVIVAGLFAWWRQVLLAEHALFQTNGSYTLGLLTLAALDILGVKVYQIAQALTMKRHKIRITGAGLHLYYGLPILTVETSDTWSVHFLKVTGCWPPVGCGLCFCAECKERRCTLCSK